MAYGMEEELPHFLRAYAAQCALGHKVLDKNEVLQILPKHYHEFLPLFLKETEDQLPPHGRFDHEIPLRVGSVPPFGPIYGLSPPELLALYEWLDQNLDKKFIRESSSPVVSPILIVKKKECSLRLCVDYRGLNEGTSKNRYPLPLVKETFMQLSRAKIFTKLDIRGATNLFRIRAGEQWKTAFRRAYGLFVSLVIPFGLTNAPSTFQAYINDALRPFLDRFCTAYLDDVLIYSENEEQHIEHGKQILEALTKAGLEFITGRPGPRKTWATGLFPRPAPRNGLGRGVFFGILCPGPHSGPRPTHSPDRSPLKMGGNKRGPVQAMTAGGPQAGAVRELP